MAWTWPAERLGGRRGGQLRPGRAIYTYTPSETLLGAFLGTPFDPLVYTVYTGFIVKPYTYTPIKADAFFIYFRPRLVYMYSWRLPDDASCGPKETRLVFF